MAEWVILLGSRNKKTRIWVCLSCILPAALEHPTIVQSMRAGVERQNRIQSRRERTRRAREASRFGKPTQNDFIADDTPAGKATEPSPSSFIQVITVHTRLGIPEAGASKLMEQMEVEPIEFHGQPCIKSEDLKALEDEVRRRMAKRTRGKKDEKYADQMEQEGQG